MTTKNLSASKEMVKTQMRFMQSEIIFSHFQFIRFGFLCPGCGKLITNTQYTSKSISIASHKYFKSQIFSVGFPNLLFFSTIFFLFLEFEFFSFNICHVQHEIDFFLSRRLSGCMSSVGLLCFYVRAHRF